HIATSPESARPDDPAVAPTSSAPTPPAPTAAEILGRTGVGDLSVHYVFLVDTSISMGTKKFSEPIRTEVRDFSRKLRPSDHVSVVTYDLAAAVVYDSLVPRLAGKLEAALPVVAKGQKTDVGSAIAAGLELVERDQKSALTALVLLT